MVDLPQKKVGLVACSGEEMTEGTITRLAALEILERLRPNDTVTICLPLFLAGGEGDRAFARFYPTIALDGCELRCAARATEAYSSKPAAALVVEDLILEKGLGTPHGLRNLDQAGRQAVTETAARLAELVDDLLGKPWNRRPSDMAGPELIQINTESESFEPSMPPCSCGSGIPVQTVQVGGKMISLAVLPLLFQQFYEAGRRPDQAAVDELMAQVQLYNPVPSGTESDYKEMLWREYSAFCDRQREAS